MILAACITLLVSITALVAVDAYRPGLIAKAFVKNPFRRKAGRWAKDAKHAVTPAFAVGGIQYYQLADIFTMPVHRAFAAMDYLEQFRMNCDREFLEWHTKAVSEAFNAREFDKVAVLNSQLANRLKWIFTPDLVYQLASVLFFDETESIYAFDYEYAKKKIERWKAHDLEDFFLQRPLVQYIPFLESFGTDLPAYTKANRLETILHLEDIGSIISKNPSMGDTSLQLRLRMEKLRSLVKSRN